MSDSGEVVRPAQVRPNYIEIIGLSVAESNLKLYRISRSEVKVTKENQRRQLEMAQNSVQNAVN